eukprot:239941-Prorocentrum_minimum.AAC.5
MCSYTAHTCGKRPTLTRRTSWPLPTPSRCATNRPYQNQPTQSYTYYYVIVVRTEVVSDAGAPLSGTECPKRFVLGFGAKDLTVVQPCSRLSVGYICRIFRRTFERMFDEWWYHVVKCQLSSGRRLQTLKPEASCPFSGALVSHPSHSSHPSHPPYNSPLLDLRGPPLWGAFCVSTLRAHTRHAQD